MTRFEWFEKGYGQLALHLGIISPPQFLQFVHYKVYLKNRRGTSQTKAIDATVAELGDGNERPPSVSTIRRAIAFFEAEVVVS